MWEDAQGEVLSMSSSAVGVLGARPQAGACLGGGVVLQLPNLGALLRGRMTTCASKKGS